MRNVLEAVRDALEQYRETREQQRALAKKVARVRRCFRSGGHDWEWDATPTCGNSDLQLYRCQHCECFDWFKREPTPEDNTGRVYAAGRWKDIA